jgi:hypothetical protein
MASPHVAGLVALYIAQNGRPWDAAGVASVRQGIIDLAEPQSVWRSTDTRDPDANNEGLTDAEPIAPMNGHDVAVKNITAPNHVVKGDNVEVDVIVENQGTYEETFNVVLTDDADKNTIDTKQVNLAPGASTTVSFYWDTNTASSGDHTLIAMAETVPGETETADNSRSTVVTVELATTDIAITTISAPSSAVQGEIIEVNATVENIGNQDVISDIYVTLTDDTDNVAIASKIVSSGLLAGASAILTFSWNTTNATSGDHTLTATADAAPGEIDISDNSKSTVVTIESSTTDIAITGISAPSSAIQGDTLAVEVTVENVGDQDVISDIYVTLNDDKDNVTISSQTVNGGLAAGFSTTLTFYWNTSNSSLGEHVLIASHDFNDYYAVNNTKSVTVNVNEPPTGNPNDMYVWEISWQEIYKGKSGLFDLNVSVTIRRDSNADGIAESGDSIVGGASVVIFLTWAGEDGELGTDDDSSWNDEGFTDNNGQVAFVWKKAPQGEFKAEVTNLVDATYVWNVALDQDNPDFHTTGQ